MTDEDRALILQIHYGDQENLPYVYQIASHKHGRQIFHMLKRKRLRGKVLTEFIMEQHNGEPIKFLKWAIRETLKVNSPKTPRVGKDGLFY